MGLSMMDLMLGGNVLQSLTVWGMNEYLTWKYGRRYGWPDRSIVRRPSQDWAVSFVWFEYEVTIQKPGLQHGVCERVRDDV